MNNYSHNLFAMLRLWFPLIRPHVDYVLCMAMFWYSTDSNRSDNQVFLVVRRLNDGGSFTFRYEGSKGSIPQCTCTLLGVRDNMGEKRVPAEKGVEECMVAANTDLMYTPGGFEWRDERRYRSHRSGCAMYRCEG